MAIFYKRAYFTLNTLIYSNGHDIIKKSDDHKEETNDHYAGGILHGEGACTEAACNATNRYQLAQQRRYSIVQGRANMACEPYRLREFHEESAQRTRTKIASWQAQNGKSPLPNSFADSLDNGPGKWRSRFYLIGQASFVLIITTFRSFSKHDGGKCVVL